MLNLSDWLGCPRIDDCSSAAGYDNLPLVDFCRISVGRLVVLRDRHSDDNLDRNLSAMFV
jgi:hypothetical protein